MFPFNAFYSNIWFVQAIPLFFLDKYFYFSMSFWFLLCNSSAFYVPTLPFRLENFYVSKNESIIYFYKALSLRTLLKLTCGGVTVTLILNLRIRWKWMVSLARASLYLREKGPLNRKLGVPHGLSVYFGGDRNFFLHSGTVITRLSSL